MGKTSLVDKASRLVESNDIRIARMDAFGCRSEEDFVNAFATAVIRATSSKWEEWMYKKTTEDILQLPEVIAKEKSCRIVICIDEFQQIGDFPDSLTFQKKLRGIWQLQTRVSYCLYGSKKHMMENIFQSRRMPFYQFGEILHLKCIPTEYWVPFICSRFEKYGKKITEEYAGRICQEVKNYSSYVQQLAWNVMAETGKEVNEESFEEGLKALLEQNSSLFIQQTEGLTTYQLNFIRLLCKDIHSGFTTQAVSEIYPLGSKSNIDRIKKSLVDKEIIPIEKEGIFLADSVFELWFKREMM